MNTSLCLTFGGSMQLSPARGRLQDVVDGLTRVPVMKLSPARGRLLLPVDKSLGVA